jgi:hypothetical protein
VSIASALVGVPANELGDVVDEEQEVALDRTIVVHNER